jgi:hypothetical protein
MALHDNFERARQRAKTLQSSLPKAIFARYDRESGRIVIELSSKLSLSFSPAFRACKRPSPRIWMKLKLLHRVLEFIFPSSMPTYRCRVF